jgi:hypothetical protein
VSDLLDWYADLSLGDQVTMGSIPVVVIVWAIATATALFVTP